jgi:hypothetical protein
MKNFTKILFALIISITFFACNENEIQDNEKSKVTLKFLDNEKIKSSKSKKTESYIDINTEVEFIDGKPKLLSNELVEISVVNSETNEITYAYVLKTEYNKSLSKNKNQLSKSQCESSIERGFGFTGRCFEYGTFYNGANCQTLFVPCGISCYTFGQVCPDWNQAYA